MNIKNSNKDLVNKIDDLTKQVNMLELIIKNSTPGDEIFKYYTNTSPDYMEKIISTASEVLGD